VSFGLIQETYSETITTTESQLLSVNVSLAEFITIELDTTGDPLAALTLEVKGHCANSLYTIACVASDYTNPVGLVRGTSGDLTTLDGIGWLMLDTRGLIQVAVKATSTGTTDVVARVGG